MNLYIFEPYKWDYCGGAIGVIAFSLKRAIELLVLFPNENLKAESFSDSQEYLDTLKNWEERWLLTHTLHVQDQKEKVLFINYNYA